MDGKSEVGNHPVERRNLRQVVLRITAYAEKLLAGLDELDWPDSTKPAKGVIGRSEGAEVKFAIDGSNEKLEVYTTRPDTLFGATYMVVAPEHPLLEKLVVEQKKQEVKSYVEAAAKKSDLDRTDLAKDKSGVFTGSYCINPLNGEKIPVWVADYVLISYGTGAIMAVPKYDERDFEFAEKFDIPINRVIARADGDEEKSGLPYSGHGVMVNSGEYDGMEADACKAKIISDLEARNIGKGVVNYKLPIGFSHATILGRTDPLWSGLAQATLRKPRARQVPSKTSCPQIPLRLKRTAKPFTPCPCPIPNFRSDCLKLRTISLSGTGESPPATISEWLEVWFDLSTGQTISQSQDRPDGANWVSATRETNTMPQWAGSCWYHLRYLDPSNSEHPVSPEKEAYWGGPDFYIGGAEHAVLHLLYARFWHRFLHDEGVLSHPEPYKKLFHQGLILGEDGNKK